MTVKSPNLDIAHLDSNMDAPEDVVNAAIDAFDGKITGTVVVPFGSATVTLTQDEQAAGSIFHLTDGSPSIVGDAILNFAAFGMGIFAVINDLGYPVTLQILGQGLIPPTLDAGAVGLFCSDGINVRVLVGGTAGGGIIAAIQASENLNAGAVINVWNSSGARMRNANATDATKPAHGFVLAAVASGAIGIFYGAGQVDNMRSGLTPGATYYLDVSGGGITTVAPSSSGNLIQEVGFALSATQLAFVPKGSLVV